MDVCETEEIRNAILLHLGIPSFLLSYEWPLRRADIFAILQSPKALWKKNNCVILGESTSRVSVSLLLKSCNGLNEAGLEFIELGRELFFSFQKKK